MVNEMEILERNIITSYNKLLKLLLEEGDMDALERVVMDDDYRNELMRVQLNQDIHIEHYMYADDLYSKLAV